MKRFALPLALLVLTGAPVSQSSPAQEMNAPALELVQAVTIQSEFNAKTQRGQDAKLTQRSPNGGGPAACADPTVMPKTASKGFQNLCALAPLRLCVESLLHGYVEGQRPLIIGQRGYPTMAPENTLPSFKLALLAGADFV